LREVTTGNGVVTIINYPPEAVLMVSVIGPFFF